MYTPRYGMNHIARQTVAARLTAMRQAENRESGPRAAVFSQSHEEEAGALWLMLTVIGVVALVAIGSVAAAWVGGL